ncbi:hypothetical protein WH95_02255 [Kiloniella litopenaei]|uniref:Uncharacterized protein n=1 Tax=Kiloniella litopenaei TaxID=1549748 RepID=A0A0M2RDX1_9PROT|nr:hypothetical protein [Kiloniella litopenaei]KKJ78185.1 hypothetical protein WH95_02255 [Kiloniella litopenaei]
MSNLTEFRYLNGAVYILENSEAKRVKIGMTISKVEDRLNDVNDIWQERKVTCQICGGRLVNFMGLLPSHIVSGKSCAGGNKLPLEKDIEHAVSYKNSLMGRLPELNGSEKGSVTRMINTLEKRINKYRHYSPLPGFWKFRFAYYTKAAEQVELLSHQYLEDYLDRLAPIGEVFSCDVSTATEAVEKALYKLGLFELSKKTTQYRA